MQVVVGVAIEHAGRVLAARRTHPPALAGRWELPGGKVEPGEDTTTAAVREVAEELGCGVAVTGWLDGTVPVTADLELRVATAVLVEGDPVPTEHDAVRWLRAEELDTVAWLETEGVFVRQLRERMAR